MSCCGGPIVPPLPANNGGGGRRIDFGRPVNPYRGYNAANRKNDKRRLKLLGGRLSVTYESLFYLYLAALAVGLAYQRGWF